MFFSTKRNNGDSDMLIDQFREDLTNLREELDDHLHSINDNTDEISFQNNFICEIDQRITKMEEKVDQLHFFLKQLLYKSNVSVELSKDDQRVFLMLYTHDNFLQINEICEKLFLSRSVVEESLNSMMDKGIPLEREVLNGSAYFRMTKDFKLKQAKENMIKIDPEITGQYQNALLEQFFGNA